MKASSIRGRGLYLCCFIVQGGFTELSCQCKSLASNVRVLYGFNMCPSKLQKTVIISNDAVSIDAGMQT